MSDQQRQIEQLSRLLEVLRKADSGVATGTWTPTLIGLTTAGTLTYAGTTFGEYTRIGDRVFINGRVAVSAVPVAPVGILVIQGLPFASAAVNTAGTMHFAHWSIFSLGGGANTYLGGWVESGVSRISLMQVQNGGGAVAYLTNAVAGIAANTDLTFSGHYRV